MRQYVRFNSPRQFSMSLWKVGGALHSPNGMLSLVEAHTSQSEGGILLGFLRHGYLPEPRVHIERRVEASSCKAFQRLADAGERVGILYRQRIEPPEVNTKAERPVFLSHQDNSVTPWAVTWSDHACIQHQLQVISHLVQLWRRDPAEPLLEGRGIRVLKDDFVFGRLCVAHVLFFKEKDIVVLLQEATSLSACSVGHSSRPDKSNFSMSSPDAPPPLRWRRGLVPWLRRR